MIFILAFFVSTSFQSKDYCVSSSADRATTFDYYWLELLESRYPETDPAKPENIYPMIDEIVTSLSYSLFEASSQSEVIARLTAIQKAYQASLKPNGPPLKARVWAALDERLQERLKELLRISKITSESLEGTQQKKVILHVKNLKRPRESSLAIEPDGDRVSFTAENPRHSFLGFSSLLFSLPTVAPVSFFLKGWPLLRKRPIIYELHAVFPTGFLLQNFISENEVEALLP